MGFDVGGNLRAQHFDQGFFQFARAEAERTGETFISDPAVSIDHVKPIGPSGIGSFRRVFDIVDQGGKFYPKLGQACPGHGGPLFG